MNGVFNTGLEFWQLIVGILTFVFGFVAIKISLTFDLNKYLEDRRKSYIPKLQNACPHVNLTSIGDGQIEVTSHFISPPGTMQWQCQRCKLVKYTQESEIRRDAEYYIKNVDEYLHKNKRFAKLLKRSGMV